MSGLLSTKAFRLALVQLNVTANKTKNLMRAKEMVMKAASNGANVVVLPECFNSPYGTSYFSEYAEDVPEGETSTFLRSLAKEAKIYLVGGSIPERVKDSSKFFNTCTVWSPEGVLLDTFRKIHLFDISIPGKIEFKESEILSPGSHLAIVDTVYGKLGVAICYDLRFPELAMLAARRHGVLGMIYPGAFNMTTGPLHWELLARARAVDQQMYVALCSPARDPAARYVAWGHSVLVDPWGQVQGQLGETEGVLEAAVDPAVVDEVRMQIPIGQQRRFDVYPDICKAPL